MSGPRRLGWLALALALALLLGFLGFLRAAMAPPEAPELHTDGIAVLTGGAERVATGLRLLREGRGERMLISGVHPGALLDELDGGEALGPLAQRVQLGRTATTTRGNAREVAAWSAAQRLHSVRVVTAGYHMPRALLELRRAAPGLTLLPWPVTPARLSRSEALREPRTWTLLLGEYGKLLAAWTGLHTLFTGPS